jgi:hypothetical protein
LKPAKKLKKFEEAVRYAKKLKIRNFTKWKPEKIEA